MAKKFTGGDHLTGLEQKVHQVLMSTELNNGYGAYQVTFAKSGKSGISFGGNQMDLSTAKKPDPEKTEAENMKNPIYIFQEIIKNATYPDGSNIFTAEEVAKIINDDKYTQAGLTTKQAFGDKLDKVNQALSSEYGVKMIDAVYPSVITKEIAHVRKNIESLQNREYAQAILNNEEFIIRLVDYNNQFGFDSTGPLMKFLQGELIDVKMKPKKPNGQDDVENFVTRYLQLTDTPTVDDLIAFIRATHMNNYTEEGFKTVEGRLKKLAAFFGCTHTEHEFGKSYLGPMHKKIEIGNDRDMSLKDGRLTLYKHMLNVVVDLKNMKSCSVYIKYDDHAWLQVNGKTVHESSPDVSVGQIVTENGKRKIVTQYGEIAAETSKSSTGTIDITKYLVESVNTITLSVLVEDAGCAYMAVEYTAC